MFFEKALALWTQTVRIDAPGASAKFTNSTFAGNLAAKGGGTYNQNGLVQLQFCTFVGNAATHGGAIDDESTRPDGTSVNGTILAASGSGGNCDASLGNLADGQTNISDDESCGFVGTGPGASSWATVSIRCSTRPA